MLVKGTMKCEIEISSKEAIKALFQRFGLKYCDIYSYSIREINGVKGIYRCYDSSLYYGNLYYEYILVKEGEKAIEIFNALCLLNDTLENYLLEEKESKKNKSHVIKKEYTHSC